MVFFPFTVPWHDVRNALMPSSFLTFRPTAYLPPFLSSILRSIPRSLSHGKRTGKKEISGSETVERYTIFSGTTTGNKDDQDVEGTEGMRFSI
jgi:hypothetical protein